MRDGGRDRPRYVTGTLAHPAGADHTCRSGSLEPPVGLSVSSHLTLLPQLPASLYFIANLTFPERGELQVPTESEGLCGSPVGVGSHFGRQIQEEGNAQPDQIPLDETIRLHCRPLRDLSTTQLEMPLGSIIRLPCLLLQEVLSLCLFLFGAIPDYELLEGRDSLCLVFASGILQVLNTYLK